MCLTSSWLRAGVSIARRAALEIALFVLGVRHGRASCRREGGKHGTG
jgi:hypothetical protein